MRFGISVTSEMRPKLLRIRFWAVGRSDMADLLRLGPLAGRGPSALRQGQYVRITTKGRAAPCASGLVGLEGQHPPAAAAATRAFPVVRAAPQPQRCSGRERST